MNFADRLIAACREKQSVLVVGLDPRWGSLPPGMKEPAVKSNGLTAQAAALAFYLFGKEIIDAVADVAVAVKPQLAFYEQYGPWGIHALLQTVEYAKLQGLLVIGDAKRGDIGSTAEAYAQAYLGGLAGREEPVFSFDLDALTVNAYLGSDGVQPFLRAAAQTDSGVFALVKTSNPSSGELQDQLLCGDSSDGHRDQENEPVYARLARQVASWGEQLIGASGYSSLGAVVGATYPKEAQILRQLMPKNIFLVPGYGAQGGTAADVVPAFNEDGLGAVVNSSRGIIFAYQKMPEYGAARFAAAARAAAIAARDDINAALRMRQRDV